MHPDPGHRSPYPADRSGVRYWSNVLTNAHRRLARIRARAERAEDAIFAEYQEIVAKELASMSNESNDSAEAFGG